MSKFRIVMATLLAVALAAPAMAFDVKIKGDFNNRFVYTTNTALTQLDVISKEAAKYVNVTDAQIISDLAGLTKEGDDSDDFFAEVKYRLIFEATDDDKKVKGTWAMEIGSEKFGSDGAAFAGDQKEFELMWANVDFELPFDPATRMIVGLQPVKLNKWVWSDNAAGVKLLSKRGALGYDLSWFRNDYTNGTQDNVRDVYTLDVKFQPEGAPALNAFVYYSHDNGDAGDLTGTVATDADDTEIWLGAAVDGQAGPLFYGATAIYLTGEIEDAAADGGDLDRKGYLLHGELTYKAGPARIKGGWLYTSGDDDQADDDVENFDVIDLYIPVGSVVIFDSFGDDNTASRSPYVRDRGYNMPYISLDYDMDDKTSVGASWFWHNTAEDIAGEDEIGHELAVRASHKITKNLTAGIQAGYLIGGDAWEELAAGDDDDMFRTDASLRLKF